MELTFSDSHLMELSSQLDINTCERLAGKLRIPTTDISRIMSHRNVEMQPGKILECWKQRCGSEAMCETLVKALLGINRTDLAEKVVALLLSSRETTIPGNQTWISSIDSSVATPPSPAGSSGIEDMSSSDTMSPVSPITTPRLLTDQAKEMIMSTLTELEEAFAQLTMFVRNTLTRLDNVSIKVITDRFSMLPQSIKQVQKRDDNYTVKRKTILNSTTVDELFHNLTDLEHWSYMTPDILEHIVQDVENKEMHDRIEEYKKKLSSFKATTKLGDLKDIKFAVPVYCVELTMKVEGWNEMTIKYVEENTLNLMQRVVSGQKSRPLLTNVTTGCMKITFILLEPFKIRADIKPEIFKGDGVLSIQIDGDTLYSHDHTEIQVRLTVATGKFNYIISNR